MSTKSQIQTQAKTPAAATAARMLQPPVAVPEREADRPDIATQLEGAVRLGHSLAAITVRAMPSRIQIRPLIQRQELPEEDEEELQIKRESPAIQRQELPDEEEEELQMKPESAALQRQGQGDGFRLDTETVGRINRARRGGQPLDSAIQAQMGETMGHDFSGVRVHTDSEADTLNQQLSAKAFTTGQDLFFRQGEYNPGSDSGRELIGHELTHVVQQSTGRVGGDGSGMTVRPSGDAFEQEADDLGRQANSDGYIAGRATDELEDQSRGPTDLGEIIQLYTFPESKLNDQPEDILKEFDNNWFEAKQKLVYEYDSADVGTGLELMRKLIEYRKEEVDGLLKEVISEIALKHLGDEYEQGTISPTKNGYRYEAVPKAGVVVNENPMGIIEALAPGSQDVTSDYDITFSIPGAPELEVDAVELFNRMFAERWRHPSSVVFDTNVYTSGFMSGEARETYEAELEPELSQSTKRRRERIQLALSLLPICQYIARRDKADWEAFKTAVIEDAVEYLQRPGRTQERTGRTPEDANKVMADVSEILAETERLFGETEEVLGKGKLKHGKVASIMGKDAPGLIEEINYLNRQYEKQLDEVKAILKERQNILTSKEAGWEQELATNLINFDRAQGKALVYAQEAYYSAGPVIHVVEGMQAGGKVVLTPDQKLQSILMNIGYKLQHYEHIRKENGEHREEQAKMGTAKYGQRIGHAAVWEQAENELKEVAAVQELLTSEKRLVALKKGKLTEQRLKVAVAKEVKPPALAMDKFVAIAIETITPYLIAHYHPEERAK